MLVLALLCVRLRRFDSLDRDGSGEIDSSELAHPLLSTGLARSSQEVADLVIWLVAPSMLRNL